MATVYPDICSVGLEMKDVRIGTVAANPSTEEQGGGDAKND